ncbi:dynein regulatory complex protein 8-like [Sycon ciliatum]|uniref:dynein regulatory complex protein 8-like n=1 Tax=Sycon ciliatum TaxID=27933 RepID=UPI0020AE49FA|eukprot:scpid67229/ scgid19958/ EF-hand calcium-binding domain-containing protein 2
MAELEGDEPEIPATDAYSLELKKKILGAFEVFDHDANDTVDVREVGTIIRSLGLCPSEGELSDMIRMMEEDEPTGYVRFVKFEPVALQALVERRYRPVDEETLLKAFEVLDTAKNDCLTVEQLTKVMCENGENFSKEEMDEMLSAAVDPDKNNIQYREYVSLMVVDENN